MRPLFYDSAWGESRLGSRHVQANQEARSPADVMTMPSARRVPSPAPPTCSVSRFGANAPAVSAPVISQQSRANTSRRGEEYFFALWHKVPSQKSVSYLRLRHARKLGPVRCSLDQSNHVYPAAQLALKVFRRHLGPVQCTQEPA
jgi:hypothetical protein